MQMSDYPMKTCLELTIFIFWAPILHDDFRMTQSTQSTQKTLREHLKSSQRALKEHLESKRAIRLRFTVGA